MPSPLPQIKKLISALPAKDVTIAAKFIEEKDWESLKDLTWSSLQRLEEAFKKASIPSKYANVDIDKVRELALLCIEYYYDMYPEELESDDDYDEEF